MQSPLSSIDRIADLRFSSGSMYTHRRSHVELLTLSSFHVGNPEGIHQLLVLFSDRGTPKSVRFLNSYSGHTYKFTKEVRSEHHMEICFGTQAYSRNQDGSYKYIKIHIKTQQGVKNFTREEATKIAGEDPDYMIRDMFEAIEKKDYPSWDVFVQVMDPSEAETYRWNIFDMTKVWPHSDFPLRKIGKMTLNKNVSLLSPFNAFKA